MNTDSNTQNKPEKRRLVCLGFGAVCITTLPILLEKYKHISEILFVDRREFSQEELDRYKPIKATGIKKEFPYGQLKQGMLEILKDNDIVLDLFGMSETLDIIEACRQKKGIVYANASLEEYEDHPYSSQYAQYHYMYQYREKYKPKFTACIDAGANPGMITHFCILGLRHMAEDAIKRGVQDAETIKEILKTKDLAKLAQQLKVDVMHISEIERMEPNDMSKLKDMNLSSWCVPAFAEEWNLPSEVSRGSQDTEQLSQKGYDIIPDSDPISVTVPYPLYLKTCSPFGVFTGKCVRHPETLEISSVFSNKEHVPTVAFVYHPSIISYNCFDRKDWKDLKSCVFTEANSGPLKGSETMGATLISSRDDIPIRYYGSVVSCEQSREVKCIINPTTLQVAAGLVSHLLLALKNPERGICMPHDFDSEEIMKVAAPYLGTIYDMNLDCKLSTKWEKLLSTKEAMDYGLECDHHKESM